MSNIIQFGTVSINLDAVSFTKDEFYAKFTGRVPDIAEAWKQFSKSQKVLGITIEKKEEVKPKRKRKKRGND